MSAFNESVSRKCSLGLLTEASLRSKLRTLGHVQSRQISMSRMPCRSADQFRGLMAPEVCVRARLRVRESSANPEGGQTVYFHFIPGRRAAATAVKIRLPPTVESDGAPRSAEAQDSGHGRVVTQSRTGLDRSVPGSVSAQRICRTNVVALSPNHRWWWYRPNAMCSHGGPSRSKHGPTASTTSSRTGFALPFCLRSRTADVISGGNPDLFIAVGRSVPTSDPITALGRQTTCSKAIELL